MDPITQGVASNAIWSAITAAWQNSRNPIRITYPRPQETLAEPEPLGQGTVSYPVRGILKRIPKGHEIWVLTQQDRTGHLWPQGFFPVQHNDTEGTWFGRVNGSGGPLIRIVAVVAPPTSHDYFRFFQDVGRLRNNVFEPLKRLPPEIRNFHSVQATLPKR